MNELLNEIPMESSNLNSKRMEIIQKSLQLFMEKGYEQTTITNIIQTANVSKGGLYHHFTSKEEILDVVIHHLIDEDMKRFTSIHLNKNMNAIEKFNSLFILSESKPQHLVEIIENSKRYPNSLFDFRAKELSKERSIPSIVKVIEQGIEERVFYTMYPIEVGEICYILSRSLFENITEDTTVAGIERKVNAFLDVISHSLNINVTQLEPTKESMMRLIHEQVGSDI